MSIKQYTSLIRLGDLLFFRALVAQTILLGIIGLSALFGKIYLDKSVNDKIINNTLKKWESVITESIYIQQIVSEKEMPNVENLRNFQKELKSYGVEANVNIKPCGISSNGIRLFIGKQKLNNCIYINQNYNYIFKISLIGFLLVFVSIGISLLVWSNSKKRMDNNFYKPLILAITQEVNNLQKSESERIENEAVAKMATQVAHDIRSPLEMLKGIKEDLALLPKDSRNRIHLGINRIEEITFNLLKANKYKGMKDNLNENLELFGLVLNVATEKKIEYGNNKNINITEKINSDSYGLFSQMNRNSLKSILSNLINNAVDSFHNRSGEIEIYLDSKQSTNIIKVKDNGPGIPQYVASKLFTKGFTTKKNGNGLGLVNAKQDLEAIGGSLTFETEEGKGTTFTITIPKSDIPPSFIDTIHAHNYEQIIILDDDVSFHDAWAKRLEGLESKIEHIYSVKEMFSKYQSLHPKILLLSDFELMDNNYDGIDTIIKLNHANHSVLVTARNEELEIQERCLKAGIKLLPKSLLNYVKIVKDSSKADLAPYSSSLTVLIDDDKLIRYNWSSFCGYRGIPFKDFKSIDDFLEVADSIPKDAKIFIDSSLGNNLKGEIESEKIFKLGFKNLYLATGYEKESINKPSWILDVHSKSPEVVG